MRMPSSAPCWRVHERGQSAAYSEVWRRGATVAMMVARYTAIAIGDPLRASFAPMAIMD